MYKSPGPGDATRHQPAGPPQGRILKRAARRWSSERAALLALALRRAQALIDRALDIDAIRFDPFALRGVVVRPAASAASTAAAAGCLAVDEQAVRILPPSSWPRAPVLSSLRIVNPRLPLPRKGSSRCKFPDIVERPQAAHANHIDHGDPVLQLRKICAALKRRSERSAQRRPATARGAAG